MRDKQEVFSNYKLTIAMKQTKREKYLSEVEEVTP